MATTQTLVLTSGGVRSLVATGLALAGEGAAARVALLHLVDLRAHAAPGAAVRLEHVRRQAEHYKVRRLIELERPAVEPVVADPQRRPPRAPASVMRDGHWLTLAVAQALELGAARVVWPCSFNAEGALAARATELAALAAHLAHADATGHDGALAVETPLAELSDRQVLEVGSHLEVPWRLAWSCLTPTTGEGGAAGGAGVPGVPGVCRSCVACRRRAAAFDAAGLVDPLLEPAAAAARS